MIKVLEQRLATPAISKATKILPNISKPASRKASSLDCLFFRQYLFSKNFGIKASQVEIKKLFELEGDEFFNAAFDFIYKKLSLPESLKPQVVEIPLHKSIGMAYDLTQNFLIKNPNAPKLTKIEIYSLIRHELQHMLQNLDIYRNKELSDSAILLNVNEITKVQLTHIDNTARNTPIEILEQSGVPNETVNLYKTLQQHLQNNDEEGYLNLLEDLKTGLMSLNSVNIRAFRDNIVKELGWLKEGSRAEKRAEKFYNNLINPYSKNLNNDIHIGNYIFDVRENEALIAQNVALNEVKEHLYGEKACYIKSIKEEAKKFSEDLEKNEKITNEISEGVEKIQKEQELDSYKEIIHYLFD